MRGTVRIGWVLVAVAAIGAGCSSSDAGEVSATTVESSTTEVVTTSEATTSTTLAETTTTLSPEQIAEAEIEAVIKAWYEADYSTENGLDNYPVDDLTGPILRRSIDYFDTLAAKNQFIRSTGQSRIVVKDVELDGDDLSAVAQVCALGVDEIVDAGTGDVVATDDGTAWDGVVEVQVVDDRWFVYEYMSGRINGGDQCEFAG